ncbi:MAG: hypothetical protein QNJ72_06685 [Pleurocapsa sp. MO_226.B13]|nr:hypothetical protein [Pleurocapsa sp. MO_226.B13]
MKPLIKNITKLTLAVAVTCLLNEIPVSQAASQEVNLDSLCNNPHSSAPQMKCV